MKAIVVGGSGSLGKALVSHLLSRAEVNLVVNVGRHGNPAAHHNVLLREDAPFTDASSRSVVQELLNMGPFNAVFCVSGGWCGGNIATDTILHDTSEMLNASLLSGIFSSNVAASLLKDSYSPLLLFCGSDAANEPTPGMISYGVAKAGLHFLAKSLAADSVAAGLPMGTRIHCIVPNILDTPSNRAAMPTADFSSWTNLELLSQDLAKWMLDAQSTASFETMITV
jgi:dihydropteridine reductase